MVKQRKRRVKNNRRTFLGFLLKYSIVVGLWGATLAAFMILYYSIGLPKIDSLLQNEKTINNIEIQYSNQKLIRKYGATDDNFIIYSELPVHLIEALLSTEDRRFFEHNGIDFIGIIRAMYINTKAGYIKQGGSTLTQQLAKIMFLGREKTIKRKVQEAILALKLERIFSKEQIMTFYLNKAYYGAGKYGIKNASQFYFDKSVSKLNLEESAMIVGLLKAPTTYSPTNNPKLAKQRANQIIANMAHFGFLDEDEAKGVMANDLYVYGNTFNKKNQSFYFSDWVESQTYDFINKNKNISVVTTLDLQIQNIAEDVIYNFVQTNKERLGESQIALVAISKDGAILAMSGGKNYDKSTFNRSVHAYRQAGSAFKLFVYLTALQKNININDIFIDEPIAVGDWYPENYGGQYYGEVTMKDSFAKSLNSVAVQISEICGVKDVVKTARRLGIMSKIDEYDPTIALGSTQVNLLELTSAYATLANEGYPSIPYFINKIKDEYGNTLYTRQSSGLSRIVSKKNVKDMREMLFAVIEDGTGKNAKIDKLMYGNVKGNSRFLVGKKKYSIGGKTGTSQNYQDAWFIGYANDLVVGIWIGNDDNTPTNGIVGGSLPAKLWKEFVEKVVE